MMKFAFVVVLLVLGQTSADLVPPSCNMVNILDNAVVMNSSICPFVYGEELGSPRGLEVASNGDIIVLEQDTGKITVMWTDSTYSTLEQRATLAKKSGLNHAVLINGGFLYASSATDVYRWTYTAGMRQDLGPSTHIVSNVPCCHHTTRALRIDAAGLLYVQAGSNSNVDPDSTHARINRFDISKNLPVNWNDGQIFADGLRNEAGMRFDPYNRLWGVENGVDQLFRADLGGDIHDNNPGEELNLFSEELQGKFFGYPYCWSEYNLSVGLGPGTQWAQPEFMDTYSDSWCQDPKNVVVPKHVSQSHMAPLDIIFSETDVDPMVAYVAFHGSWNRQPAVGYRVDKFTISADTNKITTETVMAYKGPGATKRNDWIRPVGLGFGQCVPGQSKLCLFVTSDATGQVIAISFS